MNDYIPEDVVLIDMDRDDEVFELLAANELTAWRASRWCNQTVWQFPSPQDVTVFLLLWS